MASLWRAMALVWLGGIASPILADDPVIMMDAPIAGFGSEIQADGLQPAASKAPSELEKRGTRDKQRETIEPPKTIHE